MAASRHIDAICAVVIILTVALALLYMNGAALGLEPLADGDADGGYFTANDLAGDWDTAGSAKIDLTAGTVTGNGAYIAGGDVHIVYAGKYVLTGTLENGSVIVEADGDDKVWLLLDGADLRCEASAALIVEQAEKVFLTLAEGTENAVSGGEAYSEEAVDGNIDGAVYARDDLTINGAGALTVTGAYRHGIVCNDDLVIAGGTISVTAAEDALHANDSVRLTGADLTLSAGDDGVTVSNDQGTGYFYMQSGTLTIPACYEGIEATAVTVDGGDLDIAPTDDGINARGGEAGAAAITVNGGDIRIENAQGRDADSLDSNGSIYLNGGRVFISMNGAGGNSAIDYGSEHGGLCQVNGGTLIACGGSMMVESLDTASGQGFGEIAVTGGAGASLSLTDESGNELLSETIPNAFTYVMLSVPGMEAGGTYTLSVDGTQSQVTGNDTSSAGFGMAGRGGGRMPMGGSFPGQDGGQMPTDGGFPGRGSGRQSGTEEEGQPPMTVPDGEAPDQSGGQTGTPPALPDGQEPPSPPEEPAEQISRQDGGQGEGQADAHEIPVGDPMALPAQNADGGDVGGGPDGSDVAPQGGPGEQTEVQQDG